MPACPQSAHRELQSWPNLGRCSRRYEAWSELSYRPTETLPSPHYPGNDNSHAPNHTPRLATGRVAISSGLLGARRVAVPATRNWARTGFRLHCARPSRTAGSRGAGTSGKGHNVSAIDEIRAGQPGGSTLAVIIRAGARVVGDFPPPDGFGSWTSDAIEVAVGSLFEAKPHLLAKALVAGVADDDALEAFVLVALKRHLIDEAKSTEVGKMRRRFANVLGKDPRFVFVDSSVDCWALVEYSNTVWSDDLDVLRAAASKVRGVYIVELNRGGRTPKVVADALREVAATVLAEARGAVPAQDLARVVLERFFPGEQPLAYLDEPGRAEVDIPDAQLDAEVESGPDFEVSVEAAAEAVYARLSAKERALMPHLAETPAERLGVLEDTGPAETEALGASVLEKIRRAVRDDAESQQVVLALLKLCRERP